MQIAARNAFTVCGGGWVNPYVTDGLIAMWDAEWNVGLGQHDPAAMEWVDLSGNGLTMHSNGTPVFYEKYIQPTSIEEMFHTDSTDLMDGVLANGRVTMEIVADQCGNDKQCIFGGNPASTCLYLAVIGNPSDPIRRGFRFKIGDTSVVNYDRRELLGRACCYCDGATAYGQYDSLIGTEQPVTRSGAITPPFNVTDHYFTIGYRGNYPPDSPMTDGTKIYTIRWYNRPLTEAELAANLAVDRERFFVA